MVLAQKNGEPSRLRRALRGVLNGDYLVQEPAGTVPAGSLPAEVVEFTVMGASDERVPFVRRKSEHRPFGVPAIADADLAIG